METDWKKKYEDAMARMELCERTGLEKKSDYIFPELAESEDERIMNAIKLILSEVPMQRFDDEDVDYAKCLAYLEKCKESLHITEICKENANFFTDEDERIRKKIVSAICYYRNDGCISEYEFAVCRSWLEKQKENPKSADSIPSDCTSGAKFEDRWHKVTDSLPDNGREVLAKDKLGNILLARYDGEGWDVSVYDDEDYRCHNGISKWCEIPSEKQKEQKPERPEFEKEVYKITTNKVHFKEEADKLLNLAKKELCNGCNANLEGYIKGREDAKKEMEYIYKGSTNPVFWPPCIYGGKCTNPFRDCINCPHGATTVGINTTTGTSTAKMEGKE